MSTPGYDAATTSVAGIERTDLEWWTFTGRDPARMLSGVVTGRMPSPPTELPEGTRRGEVTRHTVLTPKGRMVADMWLGAEAGVDDLPDWLWAVVPTAASEGLRAHLTRYLPPRFARLEIDEEMEIFGLVGPEADARVAQVVLEGAVAPAALGELSAGATLMSAGGGLRCIRGAELTAPPNWLLVGARDVIARLREALAESGVVPATLDDWTVLRVEDGVPAYGADMDEGTMPPEVGLEEVAIDHAKGCYTGQEVIVRIRDRGHVNRRLLRIPLGDVAPPSSGTEAFVPGRDKPAAIVRSAVRSPRYGQTVALAYVRREVWTGEGDPPEFSLAD